MPKHCGKWEVGPLNFRLTTLMRGLLSFQLTVLSRSVSLWNRTFCSVFARLWLCIVCLLEVFALRLRLISPFFLMNYDGLKCYYSNVVKHSIYTFVVLRAFMAGAASQAGDADSPGHLVSPLVCRGPCVSTVVLYCWCHSGSASVLLYFTWIQSSSINSHALLSDELIRHHNSVALSCHYQHFSWLSIVCYMPMPKHVYQNLKMALALRWIDLYWCIYNAKKTKGYEPFSQLISQGRERCVSQYASNIMGWFFRFANVLIQTYFR